MRKAVPSTALALLLAVLAAAQLPTPPYKSQFPGDPAKSQAEAAALGYMRTAYVAERVYFKKHGHYATSLAELAGHGSFTKRMINPDRGDYHAIFHGGTERFSLQLTPHQFDASHRGFYVDQSGVYRVEDAQPATAASPKLQADQ